MLPQISTLLLLAPLASFASNEFDAQLASLAERIDDVKASVDGFRPRMQIFDPETDEGMGSDQDTDEILDDDPALEGSNMGSVSSKRHHWHPTLPSCNCDYACTDRNRCCDQNSDYYASFQVPLTNGDGTTNCCDQIFNPVCKNLYKNGIDATAKTEEAGQVLMKGVGFGVHEKSVQQSAVDKSKYCWSHCNCQAEACCNSGSNGKPYPNVKYC